MPMSIYICGVGENSTKPGGWGVLIKYSGGGIKEINGGDEATTHNRMDLRAVLAALERVRSRYGPVVIHTPSEYVRNGIESWLSKWKTRNWKSGQGVPVKNKDLWEAVDVALQGKNIEWAWNTWADSPEAKKAEELATNGQRSHWPINLPVEEETTVYAHGTVGQIRDAIKGMTRDTPVCFGLSAKFYLEETALVPDILLCRLTEGERARLVYKEGKAYLTSKKLGIATEIGPIDVRGKTYLAIR